MRKRKEVPDWQWPSWRYGPGGQAAIFQKAEDVPWDWTKKPGDAPEVPRVNVAPPALNRDALINQLIQIGIDIDPQWGMAHMKRIIDGDVSSTR